MKIPDRFLIDMLNAYPNSPMPESIALRYFPDGTLIQEIIKESVTDDRFIHIHVVPKGFILSERGLSWAERRRR